MNRTRIIIFAKAPVAGKVKTRLIPALGEAGAASLAHRMLLKTVEEAIAAGLAIPELCATPHPYDPEWTGLLPTAPIRYTGQGDGDLGERLGRAARRTVQLGERVMLIGGDCPALDRHHLRAAAARLEEHDAVLHPTQDGGYALLGLARFNSSLFRDIAWSSSEVAKQTMDRIGALGWSLWTGKTLRDVDEPADLEQHAPQ